MTDFATAHLPAEPTHKAPDGSDVRILLALRGGSLAHFTLPPGSVSLAVAHRTVEEVWYFVGGRGEFWRRQAGRDAIVAVEPGMSLTIPLGTSFQFRATGPEPLTMIAITMPPWPGADEAYEVEGRWNATVGGGAGGETIGLRV